MTRLDDLGRERRCHGRTATGARCQHGSSLFVARNTKGYCLQHQVTPSGAWIPAVARYYRKYRVRPHG